ncbi:hypothetical protein Kpol_148p1 [Vanderwaltozyma polyspora DSM 70294]|uniref:Small ribosomal subunit protein uS5m n=1 Tax=Vanderwaltozyma polyspora (strain ATCC 22028 / DSM 70294 / BCRC 21397 / CBS 2163 / NBRC 10782 / NRRL Y-8283 / UCD 57-17) TaxID=436907 RepID=A7TTU0_VANPO|nr:uncharacterized protein Kpol_148p1 [Vanderwaltozyma polyspora DSM 70294]EDO14317.1 hypothetical protein Kpol_148p1 [Vanderwaltozyma polyspora DSM 70294]
MFKRSFSTAVRTLKNYDDSILQKYYSPELIKSIKISQELIPSNVKFKASNNVKFSPPYYDDFSKIDSYWDYKPGLPNAHTNDVSEITTFDWDEVHQPLPGNGRVLPPGVSESKFSSENSAESSDSNMGDSKIYEIASGLNKQSGLNMDYISKKLIMKPLVTKRVSNQTAKGKIASFYALVVVGDRNGMVGLGEGKSRDDMSKAIFKAHWDAIRNLKEIPRYENRTIYGDIDHRYHGVKLFLRSVRPGFGLRVNHIIYEICQCAGIKDLSGKVYKSRNDMNVAKGTVEALVNSQKTLDEIALGRGKKIADVRKIYYSN